jgi:hypothetical protein
MSRTTKRTPLPVQYTEKTFMVCDGCGQEELDISTGAVALGWHHVSSQAEDGKGGIEVMLLDYGPNCWDSVSRAIDQEVKAIKAEKIAAVAEVKGIV